MLGVNLIISDKDNLPIIEMRKCIKDKTLIKELVSCALHGRPVEVMVKFTNPIKSISQLQEKGLIYYDTDSRSYFFVE